MPTDQQKICNSTSPGILLAQDIFGEYVQPPGGFQPIKGQNISVPPGESFFSSGTAPTVIFVINSGEVLLVDNNGSSITIHAEPNGEPVFGMLESLSDTTFDIKLTAVTECSVSVFKTDDVFDHIRHAPALSFRLAEVVAGLYIQTVRTRREH